MGTFFSTAHLLLAKSLDTDTAHQFVLLFNMLMAPEDLFFNLNVIRRRQQVCSKEFTDRPLTPSE